jgi:hypothetical protein
VILTVLLAALSLLGLVLLVALGLARAGLVRIPGLGRGATGKFLALGLLGLALLFAGPLWYYQVYAFYERVEGVTEITVKGAPVPVTDYRGIDAFTSPLKIRACFRAEPAAFADLPPAPEATPLVAPFWFECFDAERLTADLAAGRATAHVIGDATPPEAVGYRILTYVAIYPDGRGYLWRQFTES